MSNFKSSITLLTLFVAICGSATNLLAQSTERSQLEINGYALESFAPKYIDEHVSLLKWQIKINVRQLELIHSITKRWQDTYAKAAQLEEALYKRKFQMGLPVVNLEMALRDLTVQLDKRTANLEGLKARSRKLQADLATKSMELKAKLVGLNTERKTLMMKLGVAANELKKNEKLVERDLVSEHVFQRSKFSLAIAEAELEALSNQIDFTKSRGAIDLQTQLAITSKATTNEEKTIQVLTNRKGKFKMALRDELRADVEGRLFKKQLALKMIEQSQVKQMELELENTRNLALLSLIESIRKGNKSKDESEN